MADEMNRRGPGAWLRALSGRPALRNCFRCWLSARRDGRLAGEAGALFQLVAKIRR